MMLPSRPPAAHLVALLQEEGGNISAVARRLQVCTRTIYRWLRAYDIELHKFRTHEAQEASIVSGR